MRVLRCIAASLIAAVPLAASPASQGKAISATEKGRATTPATQKARPTSAAATRFFPVAVWYSGGKARAPIVSPLAPGSEAEWREDLKKIKGLGFNAVRTWVEWSAGEPREGQYRLDNLDLMLRLAEETGLRVLVQVYVDSAPEWVGRKYPDAHFVSQGGTEIRSQAAPGYCFDHPGVRGAIQGFFREVARHAAKSHAFYAYDLWSEPAVMNWALPSYVPNAQFCYCAHSIARFRGWLRHKHGSIAALNRAWYRTFSSWQEVEPPRFGTILTYADFMDWRVYIGDKIARDLAARAEAVRDVDREHLVTSHAPNPSPVFRTLADAMDASDDYLMKDVVDFFGTSFYPKLTSPDRDFPLERRALVMDMVRAVTADRGFYVGELQAGYGVHGIIAGNPITGADLSLYTWGLVSRGARAINYYAFYPMSTGYEAGGYGMINLDGSVTDRARTAGATARLLAANADLLLSARPARAEVAVVFNPLVPLLGGEQAYGDRRSMHRAAAGYHRMFFERNIPVEFPSARELSPESLRPYKLVIVPYPILLTPGMAAALEQYVMDGGHLLAEARPGWQDERGHAEPILPGFGWHKMFGVRETEVLPVKQVEVRWGQRRFPGASFAEHFEVIDPTARMVASYEAVTPIAGEAPRASESQGAAYERQHGRGRALILGTFAGERNQQEPIPMHPLADALVEWAGLTPSPMRSSQFVEARQMKAPDGEVLFLFNHAGTGADVEYTLHLAKPASSVRELITGEVWREPSGSRGEAEASPRTRPTITVKTQVPTESVRIYRVDY